MPTRMLAPRSSASARHGSGRSHAPCSRAWPTASRLARALAELGVRPEIGRVSGGGARSRLLAQIVASALGLPLELTAAEEGAAYGAALLGDRRRVRSRVHEAVDKYVKPSQHVKPDAPAACASSRPPALACPRCNRPSNTSRTMTLAEVRAGHGGRAAGSAVRSRRCSPPPASASGSRPQRRRPGLETWSRVRATCATGPTSN